ncbi:MAG: HU family DNA-binding protein [Candidatus Phytoplasma asteris]|nr:MAG: DNA-binding protein HU [Periwinkle leaf yellowing phytoplasma]WEX19682.1 MAG: HU family DNA-binding protein [Candidatus Phytoplasma asteris]
MTKKELIKKIAEVNKTSITKTEEFYHIFEKTLIEAITTNEEVVLSPQIGKFQLKPRKAYIGRNPKTRKKLKIPAKTVATFKLSKTIKDQAKTLILK